MWRAVIRREVLIECFYVKGVLIYGGGHVLGVDKASKNSKYVKGFNKVYSR